MRVTSTPSSRSLSRADVLFALYYELGPDRSLSNLHDHLGALGIRVSLTTLKRNCSRYGWQERVAQVDARGASLGERHSLKTALAMHDRHLQLARAVQGAGGSALQHLMRSDARLSDMKPADIVRLLELGIRAERAALEQTATRRDVATVFANIVTHAVVELFERTNSMAEPATRAEAFAGGLDRIVEQHLKEESDGE